MISFPKVDLERRDVGKVDLESKQRHSRGIFWTLSNIWWIEAAYEKFTWKNAYNSSDTTKKLDLDHSLQSTSPESYDTPLLQNYHCS